METEKINQALAQLEISLKELDSARKQVEKVTDSGNNLTVSTASLVKEVKLLADKIASETSKIITGFSGKITALEASINNTTEAGQKKIASEVEKFIETSKDLKSNNENTINDLKSLSIQTLRDQETEITKTVQSVLEYCGQVQSLIEKISTLDLPNRMDKIDKNITNVNDLIKVFSVMQENINVKIDSFSSEFKNNVKSQNKNAVITWILVAVALCATVIIGFLK